LGGGLRRSLDASATRRGGVCARYVAGLIGPGDRKSVGPVAERVAAGDYDRLHHFVSDGVWDEAPLQRELALQADELVGGADAFLVIDDTALSKKGMHSVGVAPQYASTLGKTAYCQTLVSLTLARGEVPVMVGLRLFLPETWTCDEARLERAGVYRFLKRTPSPAIARRPGPTGPCPDADLADHIRGEIEASDFHGEGYRKLWARLRVAGVRSSPRRVRRVMGENGLFAPHRVGRNQEKTHDGTIVTDKVNEMWGTDMSQTYTLEEGRADVFVAVEHANSEIIGIHAARSANRFEAPEPVRQGVHRCFGSIAPGVARGLKLRHDHGSNCMSGDFQDEIKCLGVEALPSFVREPEGNSVAERFILEGELALGADVQNHRGTARRARRIRQALQ
jgi:putative transposase